MILLGVVSSGVASLVIGNGRLVIKSVKKPAEGSPPGHGILMGEDEVVIIKGKERDVNAITKGHFDLDTDSQLLASKQKGDAEKGGKGKSTDKGVAQEVKRTIRRYDAIGFSSLLLILQFLAQLLLVPQGSLFGQVMFLSSLCVSWVYNSFLSSLEKEKIQTGMLFRALGEPEMVRFRVGTRTTMAVFSCLLLFHDADVSPEDERSLREKILNSCIPNDTAVWRRWKEKVVDQLLHLDDKFLSCLKEDDVDRSFRETDGKLLGQLLGDARSAFEGYLEIRQGLPKDSTRQQTDGQA